MDPAPEKPCTYMCDICWSFMDSAGISYLKSTLKRISTKKKTWHECLEKAINKEQHCFEV